MLGLAILALFLIFRVLSHTPLAQAPADAPQEPQQRRNRNIVALEKQIAGKEQLPAEEVFSNIQTFKGMPAIQVLRIMEQAFTPNLGVGCNHCHLPGRWASDDKPTKDIARRMWTMRAEWQEDVRKATGNPDAVVTCYTCHKGEPKPAFAPQPGTGPGR
jgi:photosynthetic reaction center cytochrome c subunit